MTKRNIFYSFHFANDVMRVQQVRNMGVIEGNEPVSPNNWEQIKKNGDAAVEKWIDENMKSKSCLIVLIGTDTYARPWVKYEIKKAWQDGKGILGIHVHNLKCPNSGTCSKGSNPFAPITFKLGDKVIVPQVFDPKSNDAYNDISANLSSLVEAAIKQRAV
jgi:MTH538 TIR-like domain (DUF1863)